MGGEVAVGGDIGIAPLEGGLIGISLIVGGDIGISFIDGGEITISPGRPLRGFLLLSVSDNVRVSSSVAPVASPAIVIAQIRATPKEQRTGRLLRMHQSPTRKNQVYDTATMLRGKGGLNMKAGVLLLLAFSLPASAQVPQQDPCAGLYGFAREDCVAQSQRATQDAERQKQLQQQLQQQLLQEQIRSHQLQNEMLRRRLESEDGAKKE